MNEQFSQRLKSLRIECGLSQRELAQKLNVVQVSYLRWEQGKTEPNINNICALCRIFGVTADYLLGVSDELGITTPFNPEKEYTTDEQTLIRQYRKLSTERKNALLHLLQ